MELHIRRMEFWNNALKSPKYSNEYVEFLKRKIHRALFADMEDHVSHNGIKSFRMTIEPITERASSDNFSPGFTQLHIGGVMEWEETEQT
jgi:hypothetical protein